MNLSWVQLKKIPVEIPKKLENKFLTEDEIKVFFNLENINFDNLRIKLPGFCLEGKKFFLKNDVLAYIFLKQKIYKQTKNEKKKKR